MKKIFVFTLIAVSLIFSSQAFAEVNYYNINSDDLFAKPGTVVEMANGNLFITGFRSILSDGLFDYGIYGIVSKTGTIVKSFSPIQSPAGYGYDRKTENTCFNPITVSIDNGSKVVVACLINRYSNNILSSSVLHFNIYDQNGNVLIQKIYSTTYGEWNLSVLPLPNNEFAIFYSKSATNGTGAESTKFKIFDVNGNEVVSEKNPIVYNRCRGAVAVNSSNGNFLIGYSDNNEQYACSNDRYSKNNWVLVGKDGSVIKKTTLSNIGYFDKPFIFKNGDVGLGFFEMGSSLYNYDKKYRIFIFDSNGNFKDSPEIFSFGNNVASYDYRFFEIIQGKQTGNFLVLSCETSPSTKCTWSAYDSNFKTIQLSSTIPISPIPGNYVKFSNITGGKIILDYYKLNSNASAFTGKAFDIVPEPSATTLIIDAGAPKRVLSGKTIEFNDATTSQPLNANIGYTWECKDSSGNIILGLLSSNNILKPIFTAPKVTAPTKYYCTLTAKEILK